MRRWNALASLVFPLLLLPTLTASGTAGDEVQSKVSEDDRRFTDTVEVRVVNVEVAVTDDRGRPVTGLGPQDFEVFEDGRQVPITNFYAVEQEGLGRGSTPVGVTQAPGSSAGNEVAGSSPRVPPPPPEDRRLYLVVYVDQLDSTAGLRNRTLKGLELFVEERLTLGDRVMVVSSYPSFEVEVPFTDDRQSVLSAVREVQNRAPIGLAMDQRRIRSRMQFAANSPDPALEAAAILADIRSFADQAAQMLRREILSLRTFVASLAGLPGRKVIVHLSEGLPERPGQDLFAEWSTLFGGGGSDGFLEARRNDLAPEIERLIEEANGAAVSFFTLDVAGSRTGSSVSAESRGLGVDGQRIGGPEVEAVATLAAQTSLQALAGETGGKPILNANSPWRVLEEVAPTFDTYYSLGYAPRDPTPGKYHRIRVEVRRPGLSVRHRRGYEFSTATDRFENRTVGALLHGAWDNPLGVFLGVGEQRHGKKKTFRVPLEVKIPIGEIALVPGRSTHEGKVRVRVAFEREGGEGFGLTDEVEVPLAIPEADLERARASHFTVEVTLQLGAGLHHLAVGVWDEIGARAAFVPYEVVAGSR